ncbi:hypothetical protein FF1_047241 [Malus domestica]
MSHHDDSTSQQSGSTISLALHTDTEATSIHQSDTITGTHFNKHNQKIKRPAVGLIDDRSMAETRKAPSEQLLSAITEHFKCLDINRENSSRFAYHGYNVSSSYKAQDQEHDALVLYRREGTVVPFDGSFDPIKKRKARPKVDLDQETDKVWKLLLENINSEGINGTDEEKEKWWEQERKVFRGLADNFISRMHLVQGDRRFSPWKGSVVDSVVGVFLTQNVSDHLSSSAFMSMAAHFPLKSGSNEISCDEEVASLVVDEPEVCISENSNQPGCDWSSLTFHNAEHGEEKVVNEHNNSGSTTEGVISTNEAQCKLSHPSEPGLGMYPNSLMNRSTTKITRTELYLQKIHKKVKKDKNPIKLTYSIIVFASVEFVLSHPHQLQ